MMSLTRRLLLAAVLTLATSAPALAASFLWITDTHIGSGVGNEGAKVLTAALPGLTPRPDFIVHTGDCTEFGDASHFAQFLQLRANLGLPMYAVPGNHDTTWASKARWDATVGPRHFSVACGPIQVIGIDSTLEMRGEGHIDASERTWLIGTLNALRPDRKVILCWHQPISGGSALDYGSEQFLTGLFARYPIAAVLTGHNHGDSQQTFNGVPCFVSQDTWNKPNATANIITVDQGHLRFERWHFRTGERLQFADIDLAKPSAPIAAQLLSPAVATLTGATDVIVKAPGEATGKCRLSAGDSIPMTRDGDLLRAKLPAPDQPGHYKLIVAVTRSGATDYLYRDVTYIDQRHRELWVYRGVSEIRCRPLIAEGRVIFGNYAGDVFALDTQTGRLLWRTHIPGAIRGPIARVADAAALATTTGHVCLLSLADGRPIAEVDLKSPILTGVVTAQGRLYVGTAAGDVVCLRGSEIAWRANTGYLLDAAPLVTGGVVYAANWHNAVVALDALTGQELWRGRVGSNEYYSAAAATPALIGDMLFLASPDTKLYALDARTGVLRQKLAAECYSALAGSPAAAYVRSLNSTLDAYDASGKRLWSSPAAWGWDHSPSTPVVADTMIYAAGKYGGIEAYNRANGARLWGYRITGDKIFASPTADDERVYCGTIDGDMVALSR